MTEFTSAGPEDPVLDPADSNPQADAPNGEPQLVQDGHAAQDVQAPEEVDDSSGTEESLADRYLALAQRTQADFENYRKRVARELEGAQARGVSRLATELVPALDNLERALEAARSAPDADEQLIEGLRLVHQELLAALARAGVKRYGEAGEPFDPARHEAVAHQPVDGAQTGAVVEVYQPGYTLAGAVIRPARVLVAA
jgi:molecular chaperone GrpE